MKGGLYMTFEYIKEISALTDVDVLVKIYNLLLAFFVFEIAKFIVGHIYNKLINRKGRR